MTTTAPAPAALTTEPPPAAKVDLGTIAVVPTRHWWRWIFSALLLFVVAQFAWSSSGRESTPRC
ncbi:MAG: amino acid transporter permease [Microbacterium sp.]|jgi:polar amino acid transport system permease protein|nr:amino acid transporter permease [Microbacterium sp.]